MQHTAVHRMGYINPKQNIFNPQYLLQPKQNQLTNEQLYQPIPDVQPTILKITLVNTLANMDYGNVHPSQFTQASVPFGLQDISKLKTEEQNQIWYSINPNDANHSFQTPFQ